MKKRKVREFEGKRGSKAPINERLESSSFSFANICGKSVPSDVLKYIFSFLHFDYDIILSVGCVCGSFYINIFKSWPVLNINNENIQQFMEASVSKLILKTVKSLTVDCLDVSLFDVELNELVKLLANVTKITLKSDYHRFVDDIFDRLIEHNHGLLSKIKHLEFSREEQVNLLSHLCHSRLKKQMLGGLEEEKSRYDPQLLKNLRSLVSPPLLILRNFPRCCVHLRVLGLLYLSEEMWDTLCRQKFEFITSSYEHVEVLQLPTYDAVQEKVVEFLRVYDVPNSFSCLHTIEFSLDTGFECLKWMIATCNLFPKKKLKNFVLKNGLFRILSPCIEKGTLENMSFPSVRIKNVVIPHEISLGLLRNKKIKYLSIDRIQTLDEAEIFHKVYRMSLLRLHRTERMILQFDIDPTRINFRLPENLDNSHKSSTNRSQKKLNFRFVGMVRFNGRLLIFHVTQKKSKKISNGNGTTNGRVISTTTNGVQNGNLQQTPITPMNNNGENDEDPRRYIWEIEWSSKLWKSGGGIHNDNNGNGVHSRGLSIATMWPVFRVLFLLVIKDRGFSGVVRISVPQEGMQGFVMFLLKDYERIGFVEEVEKRFYYNSSQTWVVHLLRKKENVK